MRSTSKGQVTIPRDIRRRPGVEEDQAFVDAISWFGDEDTDEGQE